MSDFKREERYVVIKTKKLTQDQELKLADFLDKEKIFPVGCVVVENDWPIYEHVWDLIEGLERVKDIGKNPDNSARHRRDSF